MNKLVLMLLFAFSGLSMADESTRTGSYSNFHLLDPSLVSIDSYEYEHLSDPYLVPYDRDIKRGAQFNLNLDVVKYKQFQVYWNNNLFFDQDGETGQVRHAGWHYKFGMPIFTHGNARIELFREHESRHILDRSRDTHFPVYDRTGVTLIMLERK